jgi:hypothetical protein
MSEHVLTLEKAKIFVSYPEMFKIFWKDWEVIADVDYDALEYLVNNTTYINLPNVKYLSADKVALIKSYRGYLIIGSASTP